LSIRTAKAPTGKTSPTLSGFLTKGSKSTAETSNAPAPKGSIADVVAGLELDQEPVKSTPDDNSFAPFLDPALIHFADILDDLERVRIANMNRRRILTLHEPDSDGIIRGFALPEDHPSIVRLDLILESLKDAEEASIKALQEAMKKHPLGPWVKAQRGIGEKQAARLLAAIGDPYIRPSYVLLDKDENETVVPAAPRTVSALWAYCGLHVVASDPDQSAIEPQESFIGVAPRRKKGEKVNWSTKARMRTWNVADSIKKQLVKPCTGVTEESLAVHVEDCKCSRYRRVYDVGRAKYRGGVHLASCLRCGPRGKPAQPGSPLSGAHQDARALRIVMKEILKDLWIESKRLHEKD